MRLSLKSSASGLVLVSMLAGCAGGPGGQMGTDFDNFLTQIGSVGLFSDGYLSDSSDACATQRSRMAETGSFFDNDVVRATLLGAATGGLTSILTGEDIATGILVGGAIGLAGGYLAKLAQDGLSGAEITNRARSDIQTDNRRIVELINAFDSLSDCRKAEAAAIQSAFNSGALTQAEANEQMAGVRDRFREDRLKFKEIADGISDKSDSNAAIYNEIAADNGGRALEVREYRPRATSTVVRRTPPPKQTEVADGALAASQSDVEALQRECLTNVERRDDCFEKVAEAEDVEGELELDLG